MSGSLSARSEERDNDPSYKLTAHSVTGDEVKYLLRCPRETAHFEGTLSSDSFTAVISAQTDRGPLITNISGRRIGDCSR